MAELSEKYASPGLRWGLYRHDHPKATKPVYEVMDATQMAVEFGIPAFFGGETDNFTGQYVVCTIDPGDGGPVVRAWKEIPKREQRRSGWVEFARTPEHWRKLCTMALGRTLKEAGYPDDTDDLKALLLWRRRSIELEMLAAGGPLAELGPAPKEDNGDLDRAAKPQAQVENHPDAEPVEAEIVDEPPPSPDGKSDLASMEWSEEGRTALLPIVAQLDDDQLDAFSEWCHERGQANYWRLSGRQLATVVAYAKSMGQERLAS